MNKGKDEAKKETALRMLKDGELSIDKVAKYSGPNLFIIIPLHSNYNYLYQTFGINFSLTSHHHTLTDEYLRKLVAIGESLYEIYEKSMKYVIFKTYYEKTQDGSMTFNDFEQQVVYPLDKGSKSSFKFTIPPLHMLMLLHYAQYL